MIGGSEIPFSSICCRHELAAILAGRATTASECRLSLWNRNELAARRTADLDPCGPTGSDNHAGPHPRSLCLPNSWLPHRDHSACTIRQDSRPPTAPAQRRRGFRGTSSLPALCRAAIGTKRPAPAGTSEVPLCGFKGYGYRGQGHKTLRKESCESVRKHCDCRGACNGCSVL